MALTDDNFATIVVAIDAGRVLYDNVRKFIIYIFAHATPEIVPFLVFALAGGAVPLPLPVLLLLAFDVGTETLPSLALGRDPPEPGIMRRPPRPRSEGVPPTHADPRVAVSRPDRRRALARRLLLRTHRSWLALWRSHRPRHPLPPRLPTSHHDDVPRHDLRPDRIRLRGAYAARVASAYRVLSNRYLLLAIVGELAVAAACVYAPLQSLLGTAPPPTRGLVLVLPSPLIVWGADEARRYLIRRRSRSTITGTTTRGNQLISKPRSDCDGKAHSRLRSEPPTSSASTRRHACGPLDPGTAASAPRQRFRRHAGAIGPGWEAVRGACFRSHDQAALSGGCAASVAARLSLSTTDRHRRRG